MNIFGSYLPWEERESYCWNQNLHLLMLSMISLTAFLQQTYC